VQDKRRVVVRFLAQAKNNSLLQIALTDSGAYLFSYSMDREELSSQEIKERAA
jgi:hypothetical protein